MRIAVENYRGVRAAGIDLAGDDRIALVAGLNGSGKSSICQAAAAALCSIGIPLVAPSDKPGETSALVTKKDRRALVHDGTKSGSVRLAGETDADAVTVAWPGGAVTARGRPPACSTLAAGLIRFSGLSRKSRALLLIDALKAAPTKEDVLELAGSSAAKRIEDAWPDIERVGWDAAAQRFAEAATKGKGRWESITEERYGAEKAKAWRPVDWQPDLDQAAIDDLRAAETAAREARDAAIAQTAAALTVAMRRVQMREAVTTAARAADAIARDAAIAELLRPTGIRQRKLEQMLSTLNGRLAEVCQTAGWPTVEVTGDMDVLCAGRSVVLMADSEVYRSDIAVQVAVSEHDGSDAVIIDGADKLDRDNRNGLFGVLMRLRCKAIVAMTAPSREAVPDLAAAGIGRTYWVENGASVALDSARTMPAAE